MHVSNALTTFLECLEHRHATPIQLGLDRIRKVALMLSLTSFRCPIILVGGTNGKGSTVHCLKTLYQRAGLQVATYTSPHLIHFKERICINNTPIPDDRLYEALQIIEKGRADVSLTYFEHTTLAALWYFKQHVLDLIVLEVGMGGRLDATNIIEPNLSIISTVDLDHQAYLGNTREAIGYEKAGILRQNTPCIYGDYDPPNSVLEHAEEIQAPMYILGRDYFYEETDSHFYFHTNTIEISQLRSPIHPKALASACMGVLALQSTIPMDLGHYLPQTHPLALQGRLEWIKDGTQRILIDVAHNPQAAEYLQKHIHRYQHLHIHAVFSALQDKDIEHIVKPLAPYIQTWHIAAIEENPRAAGRSQLEQAIRNCTNQPMMWYNNVQSAYMHARQQAPDLIIVYGSFLTVHAVLQVLESVRGDAL